jgi:hypothetical protein
MLFSSQSLIKKQEILMLEIYLESVKNHPLISSAIQVAVLGMAGEILAIRIRLGKWQSFSPVQLVLKTLIWAFLGISFKYAFTGFFGFVGDIVKCCVPVA